MVTEDCIPYPCPMLYIHPMDSIELQAELAKVAQQCLARKVRQASRVICAAYDEALRPHGIKVSQFNLLVAVGLFGDASPADLGKGLALEKSTVSRNVERMVESGLMVANRGKDQRAKTYRLTLKGRALLKRALPDWRAAEQVARERIGADGVAGLDLLADCILP
jgi:DNA-binding MarR family transcriptional regulator